MQSVLLSEICEGQKQCGSLINAHTTAQKNMSSVSEEKAGGVLALRLCVCFFFSFVFLFSPAMVGRLTCISCFIWDIEFSFHAP